MPANRNSLLAIDPGTRHLGYASFDNGELEDYGVRDLRHVNGAEDLFTAVNTVMSRLLSQKSPVALAIEKNTFSQVQQNLRLTLTIGKIRQLARRRRIRVFEYDPRTIRKVVWRDGNATKREVARTLTVKYPELRAYLESNRDWRERYFQNAFDAIACGLTFIVKSRTFTGYRPSPKTATRKSSK